MSADDYGMVECPTCGGPGCIPEDEADRIEAALALVASIPADRRQPWHTVTLKEESWHIAHPITCDLATCRFDAIAQEWDEPPADIGVYRWHSPAGALEQEGAGDARAE